MQARGSAASLGLYLFITSWPAVYARQAAAEPGAPQWDRFIANSVSGKTFNILSFPAYVMLACPSLQCHACTHATHTHSCPQHCLSPRTFIHAPQLCRSLQLAGIPARQPYTHALRMLPRRPSDVPEDLWELELPSILGLAHPNLPITDDRSSPLGSSRSPMSLISVDSSLPSNPDPKIDAEEHPGHTPTATEARIHTTADAEYTCTAGGSLRTPTSTSADTPFREWNVASYQTWLQLDTSFIHRGELHDSPALEVERLALDLLGRDCISFDDLRCVLDLLPDKTAARRRGKLCDALPGQKCFSSGAFTFAHSTGLQCNTETYPRTTQLLTSILRGMSSTSRFATVTLQRNIQIQMHRDLGNQPGTENIIVPCSRWMGGCLWVRNDGGTHLLDPQSGSGTMIRVGLPFASFDPHQPHATTPWSEGDRTILIGSTPRQLDRLTCSHRQQLSDLGFRLPGDAGSGG